MSGRLIAIGDIHGCSTALDSLLDWIAPRPDDTIVTLGDYIDRGPNSKGVIDRLIEYKSKCNLVALQGNHEEMMLKVISGEISHDLWLPHGGVDTLDSYGFFGDLNVIPDEHHAFFDAMLDYYETDRNIFLHANYEHDLPLEQLSVHTLRWLKLTESTPAPHFSGKKAVLGHTHDRAGEIFDMGHFICIDTYCYGGRWLTAYDCGTGEVWQTSQDGRRKQR